MTDIRLIDSPLADTRSRRTELIERMANDLIRFEASYNEADAVRSLWATGKYETVDIMALVGDARMVAFQEIVAREMARP